MKAAYSCPFYDAPCTQTVGGGSAGPIGWGDPDSPMDSTFIIAYTRYPLPYEFKQDTYAFTIEDIPLGSSPSDIAPATLQCYAGKEGETPEEFIIPIIWDDAGEYD